MRWNPINSFSQSNVRSNARETLNFDLLLLFSDKLDKRMETEYNVNQYLYKNINKYKKLD